MKTIRDNTKELLKDLLMNKGGLAEAQAGKLADGITSLMGLDGLKGDKIAPARYVIRTTPEGAASIFHKPARTPIVWVDCDDLGQDGIDAVEVF